MKPHNWIKRTEDVDQCVHCEAVRIRHPLTKAVRYITKDSKECNPDVCGQVEFPAYGNPEPPTPEVRELSPFEVESRGLVIELAYSLSSATDPVMLLAAAGPDTGTQVPEDWVQSGLVTLQFWKDRNVLKYNEFGLCVTCYHQAKPVPCVVPAKNIHGVLLAGEGGTTHNPDRPAVGFLARGVAPPAAGPKPTPVIDLAAYRRKK